MSEAAWNKAFTQGSRALQDRLKKVHANNPKFQTWMKKSGHGTDTSVKQASKEVKPSARVKSLQTKSLQAYGATKGTKVGGEHGSEDMRDTIAPLTRDQHSKVQAAERAAKAAAKKAAPAKPKKPLSQAERMAAIARAVKKAKSKDRFDVPTVDPDDADHDDLRDVHNQMHIRRGYNEEVESVEEGVATAQKVMDRANVVAKTNPDPKKRFAASGLAQKAMMRTINPTGVNTGITRGGGNKTYRMVTGKVPPYQLTKKTGVSEEVEQIDELDQKTLKSYIKKNVDSKAYEKSPNRDAGLERATTKVARNQATSTLKNKVSKLRYTPMNKHKNPYEYQNSRDELANRKVSEEVELDEVTKQEAEKALGGPVQTRTGSEPKGKLPLGFRRARNLARKAIKTVKESTTEVSEVNEMNHGKKLAKIIMAKQSQHPIAQNMGEENIVEQDDSMEKKEMAQTQLHFIKYAAEEILAFIDMGGEVEEWYQNKLSKVQSEVESLHSYIEGEKRRTGMVEETEQVDEKAPPGAKYERMVKHIKKGYAKGGLTPQEKSIAYATAWKAYGKKNEEVEQTDEAVRIVDIEKKGKLPKKQDVRDRLALAARERRKITGGSGVKGFNKPIGFSPTKYMDTSYVRAMKKEEVEQIDEKYTGKVNGTEFSYHASENQLENDDKLHKAIARQNRHLEDDEVKAIVHSGGYSKHVVVGGKKHRVEHDDNAFNEEVVTEAEGKVAVTPKEKDLAAHHGDKTRITYGDVIKARLKSAAAKKMGNK